MTSLLSVSILLYLMCFRTLKYISFQFPVKRCMKLAKVVSFHERKNAMSYFVWVSMSSFNVEARLWFGFFNASILLLCWLV